MAESEAGNLRLSLLSVLDKAPEQAAEDLRLSRQFEVPVTAASLDKTALQRRAKLEQIDYQQLLAQSPATSQLLAKPATAALAQDDIANLSHLEQALRFTKNSGKALLSGLYGFSEGVAGQAQAASELLSHYITSPLAGSVLPVDIAAPLADSFKQFRQSQTAWRQFLTPPSHGNVEAGYYAGLQSLSQNLLTLPLAVASDNPQLALQTMALTTGGQSYGKARDKGLAAPAASIYAGADAAIEYATEQTPVHWLFKDIQAGSSLFKTLSRQLAAEIPGEQAATVLQDLNEWAVLHPEQQFADYLAARPDAALQTLIATAVASGGQTSIFHSAQHWLQHSQLAVDNAQQQADNLAAIHQLAADSKVLQRDPETLADFVRLVLADNPEQAVYIDATALKQQANAEEFLAKLPELQAQLPTALAAGGEVTMPLADYISQIAGSRLATGLLPHVRVAGQVFNGQQALAHRQQQFEAMQAEMLQVLAAQQAESEHHLAQAQLKDNIYQQLNNASAFSAPINDHYASLIAKFYAVQAEKLNISADALYQQFPLTIAAQQRPGSKPEQNFTPLFTQPPSAGQTHQTPVWDNFVQRLGPIAEDARLEELLNTNKVAHDPILALDPDLQHSAYHAEQRRITLSGEADLSSFLSLAAKFFLDLQFSLASRLSSDTQFAMHVASEQQAVSEQNAKPAADVNDQLHIIVKPRVLGTDRVNDPAQAAQAMAHITQHSPERLEALLTDAQGVPLAVLSTVKASRNQMAIWPELLVEQAQQFKQASFIWFAHNRLASEVKLSPDDKVLNRLLCQAFTDTGIVARGMIRLNYRDPSQYYWTFLPNPALPNRRQFSYQDKYGLMHKLYTPQQTSVAQWQIITPVLKDQPPYSVLASGNGKQLASHYSGLVLMDAMGNTQAFLPLHNQQFAQHKQHSALAAIGQALAMTQAKLAVVVNHGDLSAQLIQQLAEFCRQQQLVFAEPWHAKLANQHASADWWQAFLASQKQDHDHYLNLPAASVSGQQGLVNDSVTLLNSLGLSSLQQWQQLPSEQKAQLQQQFAERFSAYLFQQPSDSLAMQPVFAQFADWLQNVYGHRSGVKINAELKAVFARMLASAEEIQLAEQQYGLQALFDSAEAVGLSATEFASYQQLQQLASANAKQTLQARALADMQWLDNGQLTTLRQIQQRHAKLRKRIRKMITEQVMDRGVYSAWEILTMQDSETRLTYQALKDLKLSAAQIQLLERRGMVAEHCQWPIEAIAEWYDFSSASELVQALLNAKPPKQAIKLQSQLYMLEHYAQLGSPKAIYQAVVAAIHNQARGQCLAIEAEVLAKHAGEMQIQAEAVKHTAQQALNRLPLKAVLAEPYLRSEAKYALLAKQAYQQQSWQQAAIAKRRQLFNFYAADYARQIQQQVTDALGHWHLFVNENQGMFLHEKSIIIYLLQRYKLTTNQANGLYRQQDLVDWLSRLQHLSLLVELPTWMLQGPARSYLSLTPLEFNALQSGLTSLVYMEGIQNRVFTSSGKASFNELKMAMNSSIILQVSAPKQQLPVALIEGFDELANNAANAVLYLESGNTQGAIWQYMIRPAIDSAGFANSFRAQSLLSLSAILAPWYQQQLESEPEIYYASLGLSLSRDMALSLALYTGNEGSLQYLLASHGWQAGQLQPVLASLTAEDWHIVQKIWDFFSDLTPHINRLWQKLYGVPAPCWSLQPRWLMANNAQGEAVEVRLRGGFCPVRFQPFTQDQPQALQLSATLRFSYINSLEMPDQLNPVILSLSVIYSGLSEVIQALAWQENVVDIMKFVYDPLLPKSIKHNYGITPLISLRNWVEALNHPAPLIAYSEQALIAARKSPMLAGLSVNCMQSALQQWQFSEALSGFKPKAVASAFNQFISDHQDYLYSQIANASKVMRPRLARRLKDMQKLRATLLSLGRDSPSELLAVMLMIQARQVAECCGWMAAYQDSLLQNADRHLAAQVADQHVVKIWPSEDSQQLWQTAGAEPIKGLIGNFYRYSKIGFSYSGIESLNEPQRAEEAVLQLLQYSLPLVLNQQLLATINNGQSTIDDLAFNAIKQQVEQQMPALIISHEFSQMTGLLSDKLNQALSRGEYQRKAEAGNGIMPWARSFTHLDLFDLSLWLFAEREIAGSDWQHPLE